VAVEETSMLGTTFLIRLPRAPQVLHEAAHAISL
jgi:hypothetical protein